MKTKKNVTMLPLPVNVRKQDEIKPKWILSTLKVAFFILAFTSAMPLFAQLNGNYTINPGNAASKTNYRDFHSAIADLDSGKRYDGGATNGKGVSGPVNFAVANGVYNEELHITKVSGSSYHNSINFVCASGDSSKVVVNKTLTDSQGEVLVWLDSASNIGFYSITFQISAGPPPTGSFTSFIMALGGPVSNYTLSNCALLNNAGEDVYGVSSFDTTSSIDSNKHILKNHFLRVSYAIQLPDVRLNNFHKDKMTIISGNVFDEISDLFVGWGQEYLTIDRNTLNSNRGGGSSIILYDCPDFLSIQYNRLNANGGIYLNNTSGTASRHGIIANNTLLSDIGGLNIGEGNYIDILENNVSVNNGDAMININSHSKNISILDNIIFANLKSSSSAGLSVDSLPSLIKCDFNDYYGGSTGVNDSLFATNGSKRMDLTNWQKSTGFDKNSVAINPGFTDPFLITRNRALFHKGLTISSLQWDVLFNPRNPFSPVMGAYQIDSTGDSTSVWPGDADGNKIANIYDLLPIGIAYGDKGVVRPYASFQWEEQPCLNWAKSFNSGFNHKHADCNGDGIVDSVDLNAIKLNFGKAHYKTTKTATGNASDPPLTFRFSKDSVSAGDTVTAFILLGSSAIKANNIYGIAMSINYGTPFSQTGHITMRLNKSWLGTNHKDLVSLHITDSANHVIYVGITRVDHNNVSGFGEIGELYIMMPDNIGGKREVKQVFHLDIMDYKAITATEDNIPLNPMSDSIMVYQYKSGIESDVINAGSTVIYPNPAKSILNINTNDAHLESIVISDMIGKTVYRSLNIAGSQAVIPVGILPVGFYMINVFTDKGIFRSKFLKE